MVKARIEYDEETTFYRLMKDDYPWGNVAEVSDETLGRWKRVQDEFDKVQDEMWDSYGARTTKHQLSCLCAGCSQ